MRGRWVTAGAIILAAATLPFAVSAGAAPAPATLSGFRISGVVVDANTRAPVPKVVVEIFNERRREIATPITAADGSYSFVDHIGLGDGGYYVCFNPHYAHLGPNGAPTDYYQSQCFDKLYWDRHQPPSAGTHLLRASGRTDIDGRLVPNHF